jgi:DNA-directed RNA polymerase subunit RPC12/RpoP
VKQGESQYRDGKLRCLACRGRYPLHLMHRVVFDRLQDPERAAIRDRETSPVWHCPSCWSKRFAVKEA